MIVTFKKEFLPRKSKLKLILMMMKNPSSIETPQRHRIKLSDENPKFKFRRLPAWGIY